MKSHNTAPEQTGGYRATPKSIGFNIIFNHAEFVGNKPPAAQLNVMLQGESKMVRSLRKGQTSIEIWREYGADTIGAKQTEIELMGDHAVFRLTIAPVDENQSDDANSIFQENTDSISKVILRDKYIRKNTIKFLNAYANKISFLKLELIHNKRFLFNASLKTLNEHGLEFEITA